MVEILAMGGQREPSEISPVLNYRPSSAADVTISSRIHNREIRFQLKLLGMLAMGVPLLLIGPWLVEGIICTVMFRFGGQLPISFSMLYLILCAVSIPLLFWVEVRTAGRWFENQAKELGLFEPFTSSGYGEWEYRRQQSSAIAWVEVLLFAPRTILSVIQQWKIRRAIGPVEMPLVAGTLELLLSHNESISTAELLPQGRTVGQLQGSLAYLVFFDWIGISKDGLRVWALSEARAVCQTKNRIKPDRLP
jgi:hypothetical protein